MFVKRFLLLIFFLSIVSIQNFSFAEESSEKVIKSNRIDNYEILSISQPGSLFNSVTNGIIKSAINLNSNLTFIGRANVGLEKVLDKNNIENIVEPSNVDEDIVKISLLKEKVSPEIMSKILAE